MSWDFGNAVPAVKFRDMIPSLKKFFLLFTIASLFIGGPFVLKSLYYSGTPLYPFAAAKVSEEPFQSLVRASESYVATKNNYGHGISLVAFLKHLWLIAVPEKGVNNSFDYPQGLPYLLFIGPFIYFLFRSLSERKFPLIPLFIALYWLVWWFGSQQTRFLYIPLILMYIVVAPKLKPSKILMGIMTLALFLNFLSVYRANRRDFGVPYSQMLREKDVSLIEMNKQYRNQGKTIDLPFGDVAFAQFPVNVTEERLPFVIAVQKEK